MQCYYNELHKAKKIASNFDIEIKSIVNKAGGFSSTFFRFINFNNGKNSLIIPQWLFEKRKAFTIHLPFSPNKQRFLKAFVIESNYFTNEKVKFNAVQNTQNVQSLFLLKDQVDHCSCIICRGDCSCDQKYMRE